MERRLAAILAADVVGFSRLMEGDEAGTLRCLTACENDLIEPAVARHGGRIFKCMGDGYLVEFASVVAAVDCARAWLAGSTPPLRFRIGVHLGDVMPRQEDLYGEGVNIAARLETLAPPGGLCLSEDAYRQVRGKLDADFEEMGLQQLKNISTPMGVYRLTQTSDVASKDNASGDSDKPSAAPFGLPRILLAPLKPLGGAADTEALAAGVTETLAAALTRFEEFELIDPGSAFPAIAAKGVQEASRELGATYALEGSLQCAMGKARVGVQLVDVASSQRVWSETRDYGLEDVFALQDDITAFVASTLGEAVGEEQARAIVHKATEDLGSYELMVRGLQLLHRIVPETNGQARDFFAKAVAKEPDHYFPKLCFYWADASALTFGWPPSSPDALERALEAIGSMLRDHDRSAHLHRLMSRLQLIAGDYAQSLAHSQRALELNPFHSDMIFNHAIVLMWQGRAAEGLELAAQALTVNPYAPTYYKAYYALVCFFAERHEDGLKALEDVGDPVGPSRLTQIASLTALGRDAEAAAVVARLRKERPDFDLAAQLDAYPFKRDQDRANLEATLRKAGLS